MANTGPQPIVKKQANATPIGVAAVSTEEILEALETRRAKRQSLQQKDPNLWDLIPKRWRPVVAILLFLVGGSSASVVANARAIWYLPERVGSIEERVERVEQDTTKIKEAVDRLEKGLLGPTTKEAR